MKLNRPNAGWYQIRRAITPSDDTELADFEPLRAAYAALIAKPRPQIY